MFRRDWRVLHPLVAATLLLRAPIMHERAATYFRELQDHLTAAIESLDGHARFREDLWDRPGGGGGRTRVHCDGDLFEKAGVNYSDVFGELSEEFAQQVPGQGRHFSATGISLVLHPRNPYVPTVHANFRFLTKGEKQWFGGGMDLTPFYPFREDVIHFHRTLRLVCECHKSVVDYSQIKANCDRYFFLPHRDEPRGVGGIFFDYLENDLDKTFAFVRDCGRAVVSAYQPIVDRRRDLPYGDRERSFQIFRRGRYVEFNLLCDRGTLFGLKSGGRTESILMSLPALARWDYDWQPEPGSAEANLMVFLQPRDWAAEPD
jgi:coproporphyrinogen III oxidase